MDSGLGWQVLFFVLGAASLYLGAQGFVSGSSRLAEGLGVSRLTIGLTLVAFGTSTPELATGITAAVQGNESLVLGNIVGANIANVSLILGLASLLRSIPIKELRVRREAILLPGVSLLFYLLVLNRELGRIEGGLFVVALGLYLWWRYRNRREGKIVTVAPPSGASASGKHGKVWVIVLNSLLTLGGLLMLVAGARLLVNSAVAFAEALGVSQGVIGLSLVAIGTTLPELATSIVGMMRREYEIVVGNIVGSNVFNILGVLGVVSLIRPLTVEASWLIFEIPVMVAFSLVFLPLTMKRGVRTVWWEGALLLIGYIAFIVWVYQ